MAGENSKRSPFRAGDVVLVPVRIIAMDGTEAYVTHERPSEVAAAMRIADIDGAVRLTKHFWVRVEEIVAVIASRD